MITAPNIEFGLHALSTLWPCYRVQRVLAAVPPRLLGEDTVDTSLVSIPPETPPGEPKLKLGPDATLSTVLAPMLTTTLQVHPVFALASVRLSDRLRQHRTILLTASIRSQFVPVLHAARQLADTEFRSVPPVATTSLVALASLLPHPSLSLSSFELLELAKFTTAEVNDEQGQHSPALGLILTTEESPPLETNAPRWLPILALILLVTPLQLSSACLVPP